MLDDYIYLYTWWTQGRHFYNDLVIFFMQLSAKPLVDPQAGPPKRFPFFRNASQEDVQDVKTDCELPSALFSPTLETLLLNDNNLQVVPLSLCGLMSLIELDFSK